MSDDPLEKKSKISHAEVELDVEVESDDVRTDDVGSYNIGSLIAHGINKTEQTLENAIADIYGILEHKRRSYKRAIGRDMIPLFSDVKERLFKKLFEKTFIISVCNFNDVCLSSSSIENVQESNRVLQDIFKRAFLFYSTIYDEQPALYYSRLILRLTQAFYYFYELEKHVKDIKEVDPNFFSRSNDAYSLGLDVTDIYQLYLIQIYSYIKAHPPSQIKYVKSVLSGVTSILSNLDNIIQFIDASKDTIGIIQIVFKHLEKFIHFMNVVNHNKGILEIDTVMSSFGLHYVRKSTSVKNINLTDPIRLGRGLHLSNIKNIDNDIVIGTDSELEKMIEEYPDMEAELIQKYITHPFMPRNKFDFMLNDLIDIIKTEKITNAHILLFMLLLNYDNEYKLILVDFSCNGTDEFDKATCVLRAPPRTNSFTGLGVRKTNKNKKKKKTVNKRKQTKRQKKKPTYA
jgi:hypothetical protein